MATPGITFPFVSEERTTVDSEWEEVVEERYHLWWLEMVEAERHQLESDQHLAHDCECCRLQDRPYTRQELQSSAEEEAELRADDAVEKKAVSRRESERRQQRSRS